jgi:sugar/nucleoside kinase (ribokinase family)
MNPLKHMRGRYAVTATQYDVLGLGNAIVDVLARTDDAFLLREKLTKGGMALIDEARAEALYNAMGSTVLVSGGSGANTCAGLASLGARAAFIGKVRNDALGASFNHDLNAIGVNFDTVPASSGPATARCLILVTPDGERTMNTFLGASQGLNEADVDADRVAASKIIYLEGYLWDPPEAKAAFRKTARLAHAADRTVALSLSDSFCVERHRAEFLDLLRSGTVDLVFANESEARSLYETADIATALDALRKDVKLAVVTLGAKGAVVLNSSQTVQVPAHRVDTVVDATGAGDLFAAGFLAAHARGLTLDACARLGALAAAEVISHMGARPQANLLELAQTAGLLSAKAA